MKSGESYTVWHCNHMVFGCNIKDAWSQAVSELVWLRSQILLLKFCSSVQSLKTFARISSSQRTSNHFLRDPMNRANMFRIKFLSFSKLLISYCFILNLPFWIFYWGLLITIYGKYRSLPDHVTTKVSSVKWSVYNWQSSLYLFLQTICRQLSQRGK